MILADFLVGAPRWVPVASVSTVVIAWLAWRSYRHSFLSPGLKILALVLKVVGFALLAICLIEPLFSGVRPRPGANLFVVLTDKSQSMTVQSGSKIRSESLPQLLREQTSWRTRLQQDFDVRDYVFDSQLHHVDDPEVIEFDGVGSSLHSALATIHNRFKHRPIAGVLLLSDGNATDTVSAKEFGFPVYPIVDTDSAKLKDVRIRQLTVSQTNFEAAPVTVTAKVAAQGYTNQELTARVVDAKGKAIQEQSIVLDRKPEHEFRFRFRPAESGLTFHRLEVFPTNVSAPFFEGKDTDELTLANNTRWLTVDRGGGPFRILYVSGRPNWDFKFLRRALDEDDEVRLAALQRIAKRQPKFSFQDRSGVSDRNQLFEGFDGKDDEDAETYDQTVFIRLGVEDETELADGFPKDPEELFPYHAVILDDIEASFFTADQMLLLRRFVTQRGGGLLMLGGQECFAEGQYDKTPLGETLPVYLSKRGTYDDEEEEGYAWLLTQEGWLQDWTRLRATESAEKKRWSEFLGFQVLNRTSGLKPGASLLATVETGSREAQPALVVQNFGKGRSAAMLVGDLWRLGMHQKDSKQQDLQQLWRQVVRWMVADVPKRVEVEAERKRGPVGPVTLQVTVRDPEFKIHDNADVRLQVEMPSGKEVSLTAEPSSQAAGEYVVDFWPREEGPYRAVAHVTSADGEELDRKEVGWTSQPAADEFRELATDRETLTKIAEKSGGQLVDAGELDAFVASLPNRKVPITENWVYPIWHQPWVLGLAMCCLCAEWGLRRWRGLP